MLAKLAPYKKAVTALATGVVGWVTAVLASPAPGVTGTEWVVLVTVILSAAGVYGVTNTEA